MFFKYGKSKIYINMILKHTEIRYFMPEKNWYIYTLHILSLTYILNILTHMTMWRFLNINKNIWLRIWMNHFSMVNV